MEEKLMERWSAERAAKWYEKFGWIRGFNHVPANCTHFDDFWSIPDFDEKIACLEEEIALAKQIGFNATRMQISFWLFNYDKKLFFNNLDRVLNVLEKYDFKLVPNLQGDCVLPKDYFKPDDVLSRTERSVGFYSDKSVKNGKPVATLKMGESLFFSEVGFNSMDDPAYEQKWYDFTRELITYYKNDQRILFWNVFNEIGNCGRGDLSVRYMENLFKIIREINPVQPASAEAWSFKDVHTNLYPLETISDAERKALELSDVITFHFYGDFFSTVQIVEDLKEYAGERPIFITEWLNRVWDCNVTTHFPFFYSHNVGCFCWGFKNGAAQFHKLPEAFFADDNGSFKNDKHYHPEKWQHDLIRSNGIAYDKDEIVTIKTFCKMADEKFDKNKNKR